MFSADNLMGYKADDSIRLGSRVTQDLHFRPLEIRAEVEGGYISRDVYYASLCMMLSNIAYESVKDANDQLPEFEFFRHVRNASSHLVPPWEWRRAKK